MSEQKNQTPDQGQFFREMQIELLIHDLKDPVAVIETGVRSLLDRRETNGPLSPRQEKTLKRVLRNAQKTRSMMYNLLEIGRSQAGCFNCMVFSPVYVMFESLMEAIETQCSAIHEQVSACSDSLEQLRILKENGIHLQIDAKMTAFEMIQDKTKFSQVVGNLIKNALHYRKECLNIRMDHIAGLLTVEIQDDGPGIDSKHHETVFQRYTQVKASENLSRNGHGLGLAGARIMARSMNGDVSVICDKEMGTVFRLVLPVS